MPQGVGVRVPPSAQSGCSSVGRARALEARGRPFESDHPDCVCSVTVAHHLVTVRVPVRFRSYTKLSGRLVAGLRPLKATTVVRPHPRQLVLVAQWTAHRPPTPTVAGSTPAGNTWAVRSMDRTPGYELGNGRSTRPQPSSADISKTAITFGV